MTSPFTFDRYQSTAHMGILRTPQAVYQPLEEVELIIARAGAKRVRLFVFDANRNLYAGRDVPLRNGKGRTRFPAQGALGTHQVIAVFDDNFRRWFFFRVEGQTAIITGQPVFDKQQRYMAAVAARCCGEVDLDGRRVSLSGRAGDTSSTLWWRDGTYGLLGYVYWYPVLKEFCDFFLRTQDKTGFFLENYSLHSTPDKAYGRCYGEPDIEYITVISVYRVWQATGDSAWMTKCLPQLEKGMTASFQPRKWENITDCRGRTLPHTYLDRWDLKTRLIRRTHSCDTWDFEQKSPDGRPVFVVANCDQSGYYQACRLLASMNRHLANKRKAADWDRRADDLRGQTNRFLWDGTKYRHHRHVDFLDHKDFDEANQLSMGNVWAINRGLASHAQAVKILREYRRRWKATGDAWPWWSLQPGYPDRTFSERLTGEWATNQGVYANGGLMAWVGGELALAALEHGMETFGVEQLRRHHELLKTTKGGCHTWYWPDGRPGLSSCTSTDHSIWDIGSWVRALQEGLAGIKDEQKQFETVTCTPRWATAGVASARAVSHYPDTYAYFGYRYQWDRRNRCLSLDFSGNAKQVQFSILLPRGFAATAVRLNGKKVAARRRVIEHSVYCDFKVRVARTWVRDGYAYFREMLEEHTHPDFPFDLNQIRISLVP